MENDNRQGQEDYELHGGAAGGHEYDSTTLKSVDEHQHHHKSEVHSVSADRSVQICPSVMNHFLTEDVDLMNEEKNNLHAAKCSEQYTLENDYKKNSKPLMAMNIPVVENRRYKNDQIAIAERQNSFQTLASEGREIPAISGCCDKLGLNNNGIDDNFGVLSPGTDTLVTSLTGAQPNFALRSSGENGASNRMVNSTSTNQTRDTNNRSSIMSSVPRYSSRNRPSIVNSTRVIHCPKELIDFLSTHFNGKCGNNWKDLLSLYSYSYNDIRLFGNKSHEHGYFCSILEESIFQDYTVESLKEDLYNIPKRDTLADVEKWIEDYNNSL